jgi:hypothetical protein
VATVELLTDHRNRLLDVKLRTSVLDDLVVKALAAVQDQYLNSEGEEPGCDGDLAPRPYDLEKDLQKDLDSGNGEASSVAGGVGGPA